MRGASTIGWFVSRHHVKHKNKSKLVGLSAVVTVVLSIVGCASNGPTIEAAQCAEPNLGTSEYQIGAGDQLNIVVWRNEELSRSILVRPDGKVSTPLVDDLPAVGKTPSQLASDIEERLSEYIRSPEVSVIIESQGASNQIQVIGEVLSAQAVPYRYGIKILDVIVGVGGLNEFAAGNRADLVREVDGNQIKCRVRLDDLLDGDVSQNINVYPGDMIVVPETHF
jgi:polysaccharide export outer membrane protein